MANVNSMFKGLGSDKLKELLDAANRGAQVEIADQPQQPAGVETLAPRPIAQAPATPEVERSLDMFRTPAQPAPAQPSPRDEQMMASLPNSMNAPEMASNQPIAAPLRGSRDVYGDIEQTYTPQEDQHKHSLLGRLFKGIAKGYQHWDGQGGLVGLVANTLAPGIGAAASPKIYEGLERQTKRDKLFGELGRVQNREDYEGKQSQALAQRENLYNQVATRTATTQSQILDRNADNIREDQKVAATAGKKSAVKYNGKWYNRLPDGTETPMVGEDGQQRTELKDVPIATTTSDGTPIFTTGDKVLDREITQNLNQTRMDFEAKKLNQADVDKYEQETVDWATKEAERKQKVSKLVLDGQALQNQAAQFEQQAQGLDKIDADQKTELLAKAAKAREEGNALVKQGNELRNIATPKPKKPAANLEAPKLGNGKYSGMVFPASALESMKPNFPGKSASEIRSLIEKNGGTFR